MNAMVRRPAEGGRVSLGTSSWNEWRPIHLSRADRLGYLIAPLFLASALFLPPQFPIAIAAFGGVMSLVIMRNQRKPYFTTKHLYARGGWFGLKAVSLPLERIDDVVFEPVKAFPGMGTINVRSGAQCFEFECVPEAERRVDLLKRAVARAVSRSRPQ